MLKKISLFILSLLLMTGCTTETRKKSFNIVVTNFPCYDFVRAIAKNDQAPKFRKSRKRPCNLT